MGFCVLILPLFVEGLFSTSVILDQDLIVGNVNCTFRVSAGAVIPTISLYIAGSDREVARSHLRALIRGRVWISTIRCGRLGGWGDIVFRRGGQIGLGDWWMLDWIGYVRQQIDLSLNAGYSQYYSLHC